MGDLQGHRPEHERDVIGVATDHAGVDLKDEVVAYLRGRGREVRDYGAHDETPSDYPDMAIRLGEVVAGGEVDRGVLVCGTGIGMSIAANKVPGVRAALCLSPRAAELSRSHNDANLLVLAGRDAVADEPYAIIDAWLTTPFSGEARHRRRLEKIAAYEARRRGIGERSGA